MILDPRKKHEPGFVAEITSSFIIDGKVSRKGQILKFVIFSDLISDIPINLSTMHYQGVDYVYGKVGNNSHYFVMDMDGELVGHEKKT